MAGHKCAVCGAEMNLAESTVCDNCDWEEDTMQECIDHDFRGGANWNSLNEAKAAYAECGKSMTDKQIADKIARCDEINNAEST